MDELEARHNKELRDLRSQITQKKRAASKKNRKSVNSHCDELERQLHARHAEEIAVLRGDKPSGAQNGASNTTDEAAVAEEEEERDPGDDVANSDLPPVQSLTLAASSKTEPESAPRKPNRQKARLARRAAERDAQVAQAAAEAENLPDHRELERAKMSRELDRLKLREHQIRPDGHCLYSAVADQLEQRAVTADVDSLADAAREAPEKAAEYKTVRKAAADYMTANPDEFAGFLEEPLDDYVRKIRDTAEWGGQLELLALARTYGVRINVLQGDGRIEKIDSTEGSAEEKTLWLAYYRHHFGLGEHYNSLRPMD